jgi:hypothetical protein
MNDILLPCRLGALLLNKKGWKLNIFWVIHACV